MIDKVLTHTEDAKKRLLHQYKGRPNLEALIDALGGQQIQDIENALHGLYRRLNIDDQEETQLDRIGSIVGQNRFDFDDTVYRLWIKAKIAQNISDGTIERILDIWRLISGRDRVQLMENYPAEVALWTDTELDEGIVDLVFSFLQKVTGGGIPVGYIGVFDPDNAFGFEDSGPDTGGFGDATDSSAGGQLAFIQAHYGG